MNRIAILSYNHNQYSETFIHNLVKYLPYQTHYLYGGELAEYYGNGQRFLDNSPSGKLRIAFKEWLGTPVYEQHKQAVENYFIENKIQAVHANYAITAFPVMDICTKLNIPLIVHFRGWTAYRSTILEKYAAEYVKLFKVAHSVICVSHDMKRQLINLACATEKITVIPSGANTEIFKYSDHSQNGPLFMAAGRLCDTKNPHLTILAFAKLLQKLPKARLIMVGGDENLLNACTNLCKALRIETQVEFKGIMPQHELYEAMKKAAVFVQHSAITILGEKEGTPNSIMEACAAGLPVVATRHAGISDVIVEGESGLLCDEFDIDTMAANMLRIYEDKALALKLGINAHKRINEHFTMQHCLDKVQQVIDKAIADTR